MKRVIVVVMLLGHLLAGVRGFAQSNGSPIAGLGVNGGGASGATFVGVGSAAPKNRFSVANLQDQTDFMSVSSTGVVTIATEVATTRKVGSCGNSSCDVDLQTVINPQNVCFAIASNSSSNSDTHFSAAYTIYKNSQTNTWHGAVAAYGNIIATCITGLPIASASGSALEYSQAEVGFSNSAQAPAANQNILIANGGNSAISITSDAFTGANSSAFHIVQDSCANVTLAPAATCTITIGISGTDATDVAGLVISDSESFQPQPITVAATYTNQ